MYAKKIVSLLVSRHSSAAKIFCVNNVINLECTIKDDERDRRAKNETTIPNVVMKSDDKFPSNVQFKKILLNSNNKIRLQHLIENELNAYCKTNGTEFIQHTGRTCKNVLTDVIVDEFAINHVEADTAILTLYHLLVRMGMAIR